MSDTLIFFGEKQQAIILEWLSPNGYRPWDPPATYAVTKDTPIRRRWRRPGPAASSSSIWLITPELVTYLLFCFPFISNSSLSLVQHLRYDISRLSLNHITRRTISNNNKSYEFYMGLYQSNPPRQQITCENNNYFIVMFKHYYILSYYP